MNTISYRMNIRKLLKERSRLVDVFATKRKDLRNSKDAANSLVSLIHEEMNEVGMVDDEIEDLESQYLLEQARLFVLPLPPDEEDDCNWRHSQFTGRRRLTRSGIQVLRKVVRTEQKERREQMMFWVAGITGLIGAISGLVAVLNA